MVRHSRGSGEKAIQCVDKLGRISTACERGVGRRQYECRIIPDYVFGVVAEGVSDQDSAYPEGLVGNVDRCLVWIPGQIEHHGVPQVLPQRFLSRSSGEAWPLSDQGGLSSSEGN